MNIGFDAKRAYLNRSGLGNYSRNLLRGLIEYFPENNYTAFTPVVEATRFHNYLEAKQNVTVIKPRDTMRPAFHPLWRSFLIPRSFSKLNLDIYHGLSAELPSSLLGKKVKQVVTIHDLIFLRYPQLYHRVDTAIYDKKTKQACKNADVVLAISNQTKADLIEFYKVPENKITVAYQSCDPLFSKPANAEDRASVKSIYKLPDDYILFVGTIEERKNLLQLIKAINSSPLLKDIPLVVVGKKKKHFDEILRYISHNIIQNQILFFDAIPTHLLPSFYQLATVFVYPSIFEGFGIPIIEAMFSKVPVITSTNSCFEEAGGPASKYVDPNNFEELALAIESVLSNKQLQQKMIIEGLEYAQRFSPLAAASSVVQVYKSLM